MGLSWHDPEQNIFLCLMIRNITQSPPFPHPVSSGSFLCLSKNWPVRSIEPKLGKTISISAWWHYPKEGHISLSAIYNLILDIFHSILRSFVQNVRQRLNNVKYGDIIPGEGGGTDFLSPIYQLIQLFQLSVTVCRPPMFWNHSPSRLEKGHKIYS